MSEAPEILLLGGPASALCLAAGLEQELGGHVRLVGAIDEALEALAAAPADLLIAEIGFGIERLVARLRSSGFGIPVLACGGNAPTGAALAAVRAGACDYAPLPPRRDQVLAVLQSIGTLPVGELVGRTVDEVERALILRTLERCEGNRTSASAILGISVRTMRNKIKSFAEAGFPVSPA